MMLSEADRFMVASRRLTGRALGWFSQVKSQIRSYSDFVRMFLIQFDDERVRKMKLRRLQSVKFTSSDCKSVVDFVWSIAKTYRDLCGNDQDDDLLEILLESLPLSIARTMRLLKPANVQQLIENLTVWELSDVHDVDLNVEASLEPSGVGYKRKFNSYEYDQTSLTCYR